MDLSKDWALRPTARLPRRGLQAGLVFPLHDRVCHPFAVEGREHLESLATPALFIANHTSHLDTPTALRALPSAVRQRVAVAAAADYFYRDGRLGFAVSLLLNTFPFCRDGSPRASLERCARLVEGGWSILMYPEGSRSATGELQPFKCGIGLLARELRVPVVPLAIVGLDRVLPKGCRRPRPGPVTVRIGAPIVISPDADRRAAAAELRTALATLLTNNHPDTSLFDTPPGVQWA